MSEEATVLNKYWNIKVLVVVATIVSALLTIHGLSYKSIWLDESFSYYVARLKWDEFIYFLTNREFNMSVYYLLLKLFTIHSGSEIALRGLSVACGIMSIPFVYLIGKEVFGREVGVIAAFIISINSFFITYAQEARSYALMLLMCSASTYYFMAYNNRSKIAHLLLSGIFGVLSVYSHLFSSFVLFSNVVTYLVFGDRKKLKNILFYSSGIIAFVLPVFYFVMAGYRGQASFLPSPSVYAILLLYKEMAGGGWVALIYGLSIIAGIITLSNKSEYDSERIRRFNISVLANWLAIPIVLLYVLSLIKPVFLTRYVISSMVPIIIMVGLGAYQIFKNKKSVILLSYIIVFICASTNSLAYYYYRSPKDDWRNAVIFIDENYKKRGDGIILYPFSNTLTYSYYENYGDIKEIEKKHIIWPPPITVNMTSNPSMDGIVSLTKSYERVWLILCMDVLPGTDIDSGVIKAHLSGLFRCVSIKDLHGIRIMLYERNDR